MTTDQALNDLLIILFKDIMEIEGKCLVTSEYGDISYNDFHIIEAIGMERPKSMTEIAARMKVTMGTLTKAMDGLTEKGYAVRERSNKDKRVMDVSLTEKGKSAFQHHEEFHRDMIQNVKEQVREQDMPVLTGALSGLVDFFRQKYI